MRKKMKVNKFKLSTTALAISFALASFTSAVSAAVILNTTNYMTGTNPGNWNAASLTYNVPDSWYGSTMCQVSEIVVDLPEGTTFLPSSTKAINKPFAQASVSGSSAKAVSQTVTVNNPLKVLRWQESNTHNGIFNVYGANSFNPSSQTIKSANIETLQTVYNSNTSVDYNTIFKVGGSSYYKLEQIISGSDENTPLKIGTISIAKSKTDGTPVANVGVPFYLTCNTTNNAGASATQKFIGTIENLGTEEAPMRIGSYAFFQGNTQNKTAYAGLQEIDEIKNLYASQAGVVISGGHGSQAQIIHKIGKISVKAPDNTYGLIVGLLNHSNSMGHLSSLEDKGQRIGITESISVSGIPDPASKLSFTMTYSKMPLVAVVANFGGRQTVSSLNENSPVLMTVGETGIYKGFGLLVAPYMNYGTSTQIKGETVTELKGSFKVEGGDIAVIGHRFYGTNPNTTANWSKAASGGASLKLTPTEFGNRLTLGKKTNLLISPKTAANGYNKTFLASYDEKNGLGILDSKATEHFSLEVGISQKPYVIAFEEPGTYAFVDGTFKGNAVFELKASMDQEPGGGYAFNVAKNPVVIKNIEQGSSINFLVNYDVDKENKVPIANSPERSSNDFAHLFLQKSENAKIVVKDVANHLIIGRDSIEKLTKNENVNLALYDKISQIGIQNDVVNQANASNDGAVTDRTARGTVTINVAEGILLPAQSYIGDFYMENSSNVGVVPDAIKTINDDIRKSLYGLEPSLTDPVAAEQQASKVVRKASALSANKVMALADEADENKDSVDTVLDSFGPTAQAQTTSPVELKKEVVTSQDGVPKEPTCEELGNCPKEDDDNENNNTPSTGENNPGGQPPVSEKPSDNNVPQPSGKTSSVAALESVGIANYFIWREGIETLSQRMGEVRMTPELEGLWVKTILGKNKYSDDGAYLSNKFYGITLGVDRNIGGALGWTLGGSLEYIEGDGKLSNSGKDKNWLGSLSLYVTKQFENCGYLDFVFKASRMHNNFTAISDEHRYINKGSYHTFGYQFGVEYGKQFFFGDKWFVDPQIQLVYGHINDVTYRTDTGVTAKVKATNSLIGRVGIQGGYKSDKFESFVRVDGLRDFTAKYKVNYSMGPVKNQSSISLKDTWGEVTAGTTINIGKNVKGYAQVKRSFAAKVKQEYRADIGLRLVF